MKKLLLVALAAVGLASCVQTEELAVANNNTAIAFDTFVDNVTKTIYDNATLDHFNVYGTITADNGGVITNIFPGVEVEKGANGWTYDSNYTQYWIPGFTYNFAAVVDGEVAADANDMPATISTDMTEQNDVLYATVERHFGANDTAAKVSFQFAHLLSKAKFTVKNSIAAGSDFVYNIASIKVTNADKNAVYNIGAGVWTVDGTYTADFGVAAAVAQLGQATGADVLLVPGTKELAIEVVYNLTYKGTELKAETKNLTAALTLEQGKAYNFIVEFGKPGEDIAFDAEVNDWVENDVQTPSVLVTTAAELQAALSNPSVAGAILGNDIDLSETISRAEAEAGATISKSFVLDGNGKTLTYTGTGRAIDIVSDVENETYKNVTIKDLTIEFTASCNRGINYNANGNLVLDNVKVGGEGQYVTYALNFPGKSDNAKVEINNCEATGCIALNVWGENMKINVNNSILTSVNKTDAENYTAVVLNNDGITSAEGSIINIKGGKVIALDENSDPSYAVKNNSLTGEVNIDGTEVVGKIAQNVAIVYFDGYNEWYGCLSLAEAVETYNKNNASGIRLIRDIELDASLTIPAGKPVVLDLNGKTISGTDNATGNFGLIHNKGNLTVVGPGKLELSATNNRAWNAYSSVISNNPGGNLLVKGGVVIEHLGGTDMAYGIDNLTNGKGTVAVTTIEDATVKSTYRAIRQFLNGVEATNELYVKNGAVIEGTNKSIWMQDQSKNANTGKLVVEAGAQLKGDVYLNVCAGSTEWPVEVSIASAALVGESKVVTGNVPAQYEVVEEDGNYVVNELSLVTDAAELNAAIESGKTVVLNANIENATIKLPANLSNFTLRAAAGVVLKNSTISAADGNAYHYENLTFDGLTFENGRILLTGWRNGDETLENLTITNCVFNNLDDTTNTAPVHINKDASEAVKNFTFTNNVINKATSGSKSGVYAQVTGKVVFENNVINNVSFRPYVIQVTTDDGIADSFSVKGNTFSGSSVGRAQGLGNNPEGTDAVQLVVSGNIFKDITDAQQICYWNFNAATTTADLSKNYYSIDIEANPSRIYYNTAASSVEDLKAMGVYPYYTALNADGTIDLSSLKQAE